MAMEKLHGEVRPVAGHAPSLVALKQTAARRPPCHHDELLRLSATPSDGAAEAAVADGNAFQAHGSGLKDLLR